MHVPEILKTCRVSHLCPEFIDFGCVNTPGLEAFNANYFIIIRKLFVSTLEHLFLLQNSRVRNSNEKQWEIQMEYGPKTVRPLSIPSFDGSRLRKLRNDRKIGGHRPVCRATLLLPREALEKNTGFRPCRRAEHCHKQNLASECPTIF